MNRSIIILGAAAAIFSGCCNTEASRDSEALALLDRLREASANTPMMGHQDDLMYGHEWRLEDDATEWTQSDVKSVCGKYPMVYGLDLAGIELGSEYNIDHNDFEQMRLSALKHYERGGIITMSWHTNNPLTGGDAWDVSSNKVVESVLNGGEKHELFMEWLGKVADYLEKFRTADGKAAAIIFRPWHEHTGSWFWWGQDLCSTAQYTALWRLCYNYLNGERGLRNLVWAYSPAGQLKESFMSRWPGDDIVDVIGVDVYHYGSNEQYQSDLCTMLERVCEAAREHGKIAALTETGYEGLPCGEWWSSVLMPVLDQFPLSSFLVWRNAYQNEKHFYAPFPGQKSASDFARLVEEGRIQVL